MSDGGWWVFGTWLVPMQSDGDYNYASQFDPMRWYNKPKRVKPNKMERRRARDRQPHVFRLRGLGMNVAERIKELQELQSYLQPITLTMQREIHEKKH